MISFPVFIWPFKRLFVLLHPPEPAKPLIDAQMCGSFYLYRCKTESTMQHFKPSSAAEQLKDKLADYYDQQIDQDMEELWKSGEWNEQKLESLRDAHFHTPYKGPSL